MQDSVGSGQSPHGGGAGNSSVEATEAT